MKRPDLQRVAEISLYLITEAELLISQLLVTTRKLREFVTGRVQIGHYGMYLPLHERMIFEWSPQGSRHGINPDSLRSVCQCFQEYGLVLHSPAWSRGLGSVILRGLFQPDTFCVSMIVFTLCGM